MQSGLVRRVGDDGKKTTRLKRQLEEVKRGWEGVSLNREMKGMVATSAKPSALHKHACHPASAPSPADVTVRLRRLRAVVSHGLPAKRRARCKAEVCVRSGVWPPHAAALLFVGRRARTTAQWRTLDFRRKHTHVHKLSAADAGAGAHVAQSEGVRTAGGHSASVTLAQEPHGKLQGAVSPQVSALGNNLECREFVVQLLSVQGWFVWFDILVAVVRDSFSQLKNICFSRTVKLHEEQEAQKLWPSCH